jgi:hypothetical protein
MSKENQRGARIFEISSNIPTISELAEISTRETDWACLGSTKKEVFKERAVNFFKWLGFLILGCAILLFALFGAKSAKVTSAFSLKGFPIFALVCMGLFVIFVSLFGLAEMLFTRVMPKVDKPARTVKSFLSGIIWDKYSYSWATLGSKTRSQFSSPKHLAIYWKKAKNVLINEARRVIIPENNISNTNRDYAIDHGEIEILDSSDLAAIVSAHLILKPRNLDEKSEQSQKKIVIFRLLFGVMRGGKRWYLANAEADLSQLSTDEELS